MISPLTICYALEMAYDFVRVKYLCDRTEDNRKLFEELEDAVNEIRVLEFEIEGFERVKWTKFDPDDETTYPPKGRFIAYGAFEGQPIGIFFGFNYDNESTKKAYSGILKHWMHAPKPPRD